MKYTYRQQIAIATFFNNFTNDSNPFTTHELEEYPLNNIKDKIDIILNDKYLNDDNINTRYPTKVFLGKINRNSSKTQLITDSNSIRLISNENLFNDRLFNKIPLNEYIYNYSYYLPIKKYADQNIDDIFDVKFEIISNDNILNILKQYTTYELILRFGFQNYIDESYDRTMIVNNIYKNIEKGFYYYSEDSFKATDRSMQNYPIIKKNDNIVISYTGRHPYKLIFSLNDTTYPLSSVHIYSICTLNILYKVCNIVFDEEVLIE